MWQDLYLGRLTLNPCVTLNVQRKTLSFLEFYSFLDNPTVIFKELFRLFPSCDLF